jgi:hypothetical protein
MTSCAAVDLGAAATPVLRDLRSDGLDTQLHNEVRVMRQSGIQIVVTSPAR